MIVLVTDAGQFDAVWPYTRERLVERLAPEFDVRVVDTTARPLTDTDLAPVDFIAWFGGDLDGTGVASAPRLRAVAGVTDACAPPFYGALLARGIPMLDATRAWAPSVAEVGVALSIAALRRFPWHQRRLQGRVAGAWSFPAQQMADDERFANGDLGTKRVGVIGLGAIGGRIAALSRAFGATVRGHDPHQPARRFEELGCEEAGVDELVAWADVLHVAVPPTPSAQGMIDAGRIARLRSGAIVVSVTRAAAIDTDALRRRVGAGELVWASDVFDVEPLPPDDPLLDCDNAVLLPHVAGRTRDTCLRVADLIADDFLRIAAGEQPVCALRPEAVALRTGAAPLMDSPGVLMG